MCGVGSRHTGKTDVLAQNVWKRRTTEGNENQDRNDSLGHQLRSPFRPSFMHQAVTLDQALCRDGASGEERSRPCSPGPPRAGNVTRAVSLFSSVVQKSLELVTGLKKGTFGPKMQLEALCFADDCGEAFTGAFHHPRGKHPKSKLFSLLPGVPTWPPRRPSL